MAGERRDDRRGGRDAVLAELLDELRHDRGGVVARGWRARLTAQRARLTRRLAAGAPRAEAEALRLCARALAAGETLIVALAETARAK